MFQLFSPSKFQHNSLAFVAGLKKATDEGSLPEIARNNAYFLHLNVFFYLQRIKILYFIVEYKADPGLPVKNAS